MTLMWRKLYLRIWGLLKNALPFFTGTLGRWWGSNPAEKRQEEIDILAYRKESALFCECKWTNTPVDINVLDSLTKKTKLFGYKKVWLWLFSKTGFSERLTEEANKQDNVRLILFEDMLKK